MKSSRTGTISNLPCVVSDMKRSRLVGNCLPPREALNYKEETRMEKKGSHAKKGGKSTWISLGDVRINKFDKWNWEVEEKRKGVWQFVGFYSKPEAAIERICSLCLEPHKRMEVNELLAMFKESIKNITELIMLDKGEKNDTTL
jgi:hypothetical protein